MSYTMAATLFVIASEAMVWLLLYVRTCHRNERLPFGKLRVKLFRFLLSRTGDIRKRLFYARVLFGASPLSDWADRRIASDKELEHRIRLGAHLLHMSNDDVAAIENCQPCKEALFSQSRRKTLKDCIARNETTTPLEFDVGGEG